MRDSVLKVRDGDVTAASPSGYNDRIFRLEGSTSTPSSGNVWRLNLREVQPSLAATETVQVSIRVPEEVTRIIVFWGGARLATWVWHANDQRARKHGRGGDKSRGSASDGNLARTRIQAKRSCNASKEKEPSGQ